MEEDQQLGRAFKNVQRVVRDGAVDSAVIVEGGVRRSAAICQEVVDYTKEHMVD